MKNQRIKTLLILCVILLYGAMAVASSSTSSAEKVGEVSDTNSATASSDTGSKSESSETVEDAINDTTDNADTGNSIQTAEEPEPEAEQSLTLHVGDSYSDGGVEYTFLSSGEYQSDNQFLQPGEGNKYIFIQVHVVNNSSNDETVSAFSFDGYADGYSVDQFYSGDNTLSGTLSPGRSTSGYVYFEVPQTASEIEIEFTLNVFTKEKLIFVYEGNKESGIEMENNSTATESAFHVGDIVEDGDIRILYLSCGVYESDNMFVQPAEGNLYLSFEFEVENISSSDKMISSFSFDCYADGVDCDGCFIRDDDLQATLSPGRKARGTVTFEVPATAQIVELEYLSNAWTGNRIVFAAQ